MQMSLEIMVLGSIVLLSLILTIINAIRLSKTIKHYDGLTKGIEPKSLIKALEGIQKTLAEHERSNTISRKELTKIEESLKSHLQTATLKRFNPFGDTGGDQSFILALLDGNRDGVVITSLHSRENTRFYVKSVKGGVGIDHPLSPDEQKIIKR